MDNSKNPLNNIKNTTIMYGVSQILQCYNEEFDYCADLLSRFNDFINKFKTLEIKECQTILRPPIQTPLGTLNATCGLKALIYGRKFEIHKLNLQPKKQPFRKVWLNGQRKKIRKKSKNRLQIASPNYLLGTSLD